MSVDLATEVRGKSTAEIAAYFQEQVDSGQMTSAQTVTALQQLQAQGIISVTVADACITELTRVASGGKPTLSTPSTKIDGDSARGLSDIFQEFKDGTNTPEGEWGKIGEMDIGFLALLLSHKTKENLVQSVKETLKLRQDEIKTKSDYILAEQKKILDKQHEMQQHQGFWDKFLDAMSIVGAVIGAIVATVVGAAIIVGTGGAAAVFAGVGIALAWGACACTIASVAIKHSDMKAEDKKKWQMGLSIAGAVMGVVGGLCLGGAGFASNLGTAAQVATQSANAVGSLVGAAWSFSQGAAAIDLGMRQKELDDMRLALEKDKADLDVLQKFLEQLMQFGDEAMKKMLEGEQAVADEAERIASVQEKLVNDVPTNV